MEETSSADVAEVVVDGEKKEEGESAEGDAEKKEEKKEEPKKD